MGQYSASLAEMEEWAIDLMASRRPDFIIGPGDLELNWVPHEIPTCPTAQRDYIRRWWIVPRNEYCNLYLHLTLRSDVDAPLGELAHFDRKPGDVITRTAETAHRLVIPEGGYAISLFATEPKLREWGFWCPQGWRHCQDFTTGANGESVGLGCD